MKTLISFWLRLTALAWLLTTAAWAEGTPVPESVLPVYTAEPGPFTVGVVKELVLHDSKRGKDLELRITYPEGTGPFPVIVWSHGAFGSKDNYRPLTDYWASYGYVVVQPTHEDSMTLGNRPGDPKAFQSWATRPADVSFILDSLGEIETKETVLKGKFDAQAIGVGGHSFGAGTSQLIGGARAYGLGGEKSFEDERATAILLLSGQGPGEMLTERSWLHFTRPLFVMTGSKDGPTRTGQPAEWRKKPYELSPAGDKYLVWVEGLDHGYGGIAGGNFNPRNKPNPSHVAWTKIATRAFWDAYLKQAGEARAYLESDQLPVLTEGALRLDRK